MASHCLVSNGVFTMTFLFAHFVINVSVAGVKWHLKVIKTLL